MACFHPIGIGNVFGMTALSIILAFMNILPALDGGHVMFLVYEMISGKPPSDVPHQSPSSWNESFVGFIGYANGYTRWISDKLLLNNFLRLPCN